MGNGSEIDHVTFSLSRNHSIAVSPNPKRKGNMRTTKMNVKEWVKCRSFHRERWSGPVDSYLSHKVKKLGCLLAQSRAKPESLRKGSGYAEEDAEPKAGNSNSKP